MTTINEAAATLATAAASHTRIRTLALTDRPAARTMTMRRMREIMQDAIIDTPYRDDDPAVASRILNATHGPAANLAMMRAAWDATAYPND